MSEKLEKLIEFIINDETEKAQELFHQYVVESSREIYNQIVAKEDDTEATVKEADGISDLQAAYDAVYEYTDKLGDDALDYIDRYAPNFSKAMDEYGEIADIEANSTPEQIQYYISELEDAESELAEITSESVKEDEADDMMSDIAADEEGMDSEEGDDEEGEEGLEDRVVDLEDALDELKAEFDALMADEMEEPEHQDMDMPEEGVVREYTEKVNVSHSDGTDSKGAKSPVAGKNDMGGKAVKMASGDEKGAAAPKSGDMGAVDPRAAGKAAFTKKA